MGAQTASVQCCTNDDSCRDKVTGQRTCGANGRGPMWFEMQEQDCGQLQTAAKTLEWMVVNDQLEWGQRQDLQKILVAVQASTNNGSASAVTSDEIFTSGMDQSEFDSSTLEYLQGITSKPKNKVYWPKVRSAVLALTRMRGTRPTITGSHPTTSSGTKDLRSRLAMTAEVSQELSKCNSWNDFDIFKTAALTGAGVLLHVGAFIFERWKLPKIFNMTQIKVHAFLGAIEKAYNATLPYHNSIHAADVTQSAHVLLGAFSVFQPSEIEVLATIVASVCHDAAHPGLTNDFRIRDADADAITYNDISVNENMHCATAYRLLQIEENNFLDCMAFKQKASLRTMIVSIILSTDMSKHAEKVKKCLCALTDKGADVSKWDDSGLALDILVHAADLSNVGKSQHIALQWTSRVQDEFFAQGDRERRLGRVISPLCDRATVETAGSQIGFIGFVVKPLYEAMSGAWNVTTVLRNLDEYKAHWQKAKAELRNSTVERGT